jgi:hypothetical protein
VLPKWNKTLLLQVGASSVRAELQAGWPQRHEARAAWLIEPATVSTRGAATAAAIDRTLALLKSAGHKTERASVHAGIPDSLVQYDVIRGDFSGMPDSQIREIAVASVSELMQKPHNDVEVSWHLQPGDQSVVVCGIPRTTIDPIRDVLKQHKLNVGSMQTAFVALWNRRHREIIEGPAVIATARGGYVVLAAVNESGIFAIESSQLGLADWNNVRSLSEGFAVSLGLEADLGVNYYLDVEFDLPRTMARWRDLGAPKQAGLPANFVNTEAA